MSVPMLVASYEAVGRRLFASLSKSPGNIVLSPFSIGTAMAMAFVGARGATEAEMADALEQRLARGEVASASAALIKSLTGFGLPDESHLAIANALMLDDTRGGALLPSYLTLVRDCFAAEIMAGATPERVNAWVDEKTLGRVPRLLDEVHELSVAVLLNALAFSADWAAPFDPENTRLAPFELADDDLVQVPMMQGGVYARLVEKAGYTAIRIAFKLQRFGLVIVLPSRGTALDGVAATFENISAITAASASRLVALQLPRFRIASTFDLVPPLRDLGLREAFTDDADFGGMSDAEDGVKIDQVRHAACIEVDEAGCTAAAATALGIAPGSAIPPKPIPLVVDRPFLCFLVDDLTGATIMRGRVLDPRS